MGTLPVLLEDGKQDEQECPSYGNKSTGRSLNSALVFPWIVFNLTTQNRLASPHRKAADS